ncbi:MAG: N-acetylglucosamine-6-phosphate deacetylase [Candidatus Bipolaricaulis sp.]|nr:N-acetylglucosamine-6-phosphate deacetylase [Candidatus Bipolaricaulis sp.]
MRHESIAELLIAGGRCVLEEREMQADVVVVGERIADIVRPRSRSTAHSIDASSCWVVPGFVDLHVHGGGGADFSDGTVSAAETVLGFHAAHGTTRVVASLVPAELDRLRRTIGILSTSRLPGLLGVHLEGPYVSPAKRGALASAYLRLPDRDEFGRLVAGSGNTVRVVTLAPELPGAADLLAAIRGVGAIPAIGHSEATYEQALAAIESGARHVTHWGNAMSGLHHRAPGVAGAALFDPRVTIELIADGSHVHPSVIRFLVEDLAAREQLRRLSLVSDAIRAAGTPDGPSTVGDLDVAVRGGVASLPDGTLSGSTLTLDVALRNVMGYTGIPLAEAVRLVTRNPASALGEDSVGELRPGAYADAVLLDAELNVRMTIRSGKVIFDSTAART